MFERRVLDGHEARRRRKNHEEPRAQKSPCRPLHHRPSRQPQQAYHQNPRKKNFTDRVRRGPTVVQA